MFLLARAKTKTSHDWPSFMSNDKNKTQLIKLLLEQWKTEKYVAKLLNITIYNVWVENVYSLTSENGTTILYILKKDCFLIKKTQILESSCTALISADRCLKHVQLL